MSYLNQDEFDDSASARTAARMTKAIRAGRKAFEWLVERWPDFPEWRRVIGEIARHRSVPLHFFDVILRTIEASEGRGQGQAAQIARQDAGLLSGLVFQSDAHARRQFAVFLLRNGGSEGTLRKAGVIWVLLDPEYYVVRAQWEAEDAAGGKVAGGNSDSDSDSDKQSSQASSSGATPAAAAGAYVGQAGAASADSSPGAGASAHSRLARPTHGESDSV